MKYTFFRRHKKRVSKSYSGKIPPSILYLRSHSFDMSETISTRPIKDRNGISATWRIKPIALYEESIMTGRITDSLKETFNRRLGWYKSKFSVKVGITGQDPKERFKQHLNDKKWKKMVVVFKTSSEGIVRDMENFLTKSINDLLNEIRGGGGNLTENPPYYVYFLLK